MVKWPFLLSVQYSFDGPLAHAQYAWVNGSRAQIWCGQGHHSLSPAYTNRFYVGILVDFILIIQAEAALKVNTPEYTYCE